MHVLCERPRHLPLSPALRSHMHEFPFALLGAHSTDSLGIHLCSGALCLSLSLSMCVCVWVLAGILCVSVCSKRPRPTAVCPAPCAYPKHFSKARNIFDFALLWLKDIFHMCRTHAQSSDAHCSNRAAPSPFASTPLPQPPTCRAAYKMQMQTAYELVKRKQAFVFCNICPKTTPRHTHTQAHTRTHAHPLALALSLYAKNRK